MAKIFRSKLTISYSASNPVLNTQQMFDHSYRESADSPIDEFLLRLQSINKLAPPPTNFDTYQGQLVMLGIIAAVESYFRAIFWRLIAYDVICQKKVERVDVSYGAAAHLTKELLPEAILERISFISRANIIEAIKDLLAVKGEIPPELEVVIGDYVRVCQLRHCAVHRFGKLGVNNAISLGLSEHRNLIEKPLKFDYAALQNIIAISTGLVKTINNYLFNEMLARIPGNQWTGQYIKDKDFFGTYYKIFADKISFNRSAAPKKLYVQFMKQRKDFES